MDVFTSIKPILFSIIPAELTIQIRLNHKTEVQKTTWELIFEPIYFIE